MRPDLAIDIPELVVLLPRPLALSAVRHGVPLLGHHHVRVGQKLPSEAYPIRLRILRRVAEQVGDLGRLENDGGPGCLELLPHDHHGEGDQDGIQRPHDLELGGRDLVVGLQHLQRYGAAHEYQTRDRAGDGEADDADADQIVGDRLRGGPRPTP